MNTAYHELIKDLYTLLHNASVDAGCTARDLHLALANKEMYDAVQTTGAVPATDMKLLRSLENEHIDALLDLRNQLEVETKAMEKSYEL